MTVLGDTARAKGAASKAEWDAIGASIDAIPVGGGGSGPLVWPTATDCLGGTVPSMPSLVAGDVDSGAVNLTYYDRMLDAMPDGAVPFFGHSLVQGMAVCEASPFGVNLGYGGESMRRLLYRLNRTSSKNALHRSGAAVLHTGVVDFGNTGYYGSMTNLQAAATVLGMYGGQYKNWITGKWVVVGPVRGDQRVSGFPAGYNTSCDHVNASLAGLFSATPNIKVIDPTTAMTDGTGNLTAAFHIGDGQHLSKAGNSILAGLIKAQLVSLGVGG